MKFAFVPAFVISLCLLSSAVAGEPPKIDRISPPGGQKGTTVATTLIGKAGDGPLQTWSHLGQLAFEMDSDKPNSVAVNIPVDATTGLHWVRFYNEHGASELTPFVVGSIPEVTESEPNNSPAKASPIDVASATINGVLEKSEDVDVFSISLTAGETVVASVLANRELGSPMDAVLQVLNSDEVVLSQVDDDHALDPQIAFTASQDGAYFVRLFAFPAAPNSTIRLASAATFVYRLTITTEGFVDFTIPTAVDGTSETQVVLHGWNLPGNERQVMVSPQRPESFLVTSRLAESLDVRRSAVLSLTDDLEDTHLEFPCSVSGRITEAKQTDVFRFSGQKGQQLTFDVTAQRIYSQLDPVVRVRKESGELVKEADDISRQNLDCQVNVTLPGDGRYTVEVTDRYDSGSHRHFYVLNCEQTSASMAATVAATSYTLKSDKPVEVPVAVNRLNNFADTVSFSLQGLPDGVFAEEVQSEAKGNSAKSVSLTIQRSADAKPFSGLVSIVGVTPDNATIRATAPIPNSSEIVDSIWLTVIASVAGQPATDVKCEQ